MSQHKATCRKPTPPRPKQQRPRRRNNSNLAVVAKPMRVVSRPTDGATLTGTDRLISISDVSKFGTGATLVNVVITPGLFERLRTVAMAFQRIRYHSLRFRIEPQMSTATNGGYVGAFVRDPADFVPKSPLIYLTAQRGSVTTKWWQSCSISAPPSKTLYYTSKGAEIREFSPGKFVLAVDGAATQTGNLTVFVDWSVSLSQAGLENEESIEPECVVLADLMTKVGNVGLTGVIDGKPTFHPTQLISNCSTGDGFELPFPVSLQETAAVTRNVFFLYAAEKGELLPARQNAKDVWKENAITETMFCRKGTVLTKVVTAPAGLGFPEVPEESSCPTPRGSGMDLTESLIKLSSCLPQLMSMLKLSPPNPDACTMSVQDRLMVSQSRRRSSVNTRSIRSSSAGSERRSPFEFLQM